jgi:hypothetical protein
MSRSYREVLCRLSEHILTGKIKIGGDMEPGDYTMQLLAYDRLAPAKKQMASQWIDLTVLRPARQAGSRGGVISN